MTAEETYRLTQDVTWYYSSYTQISDFVKSEGKILHCISLVSEPMTYNDSKLLGFHTEFISTAMRDGNMNYDGYVRIWKVKF
jgi:hypothetical protein